MTSVQHQTDALNVERFRRRARLHQAELTILITENRKIVFQVESAMVVASTGMVADSSGLIKGDGIRGRSSFPRQLQPIDPLMGATQFPTSRHRLAP